MHPAASRVERLAREHPASFIAFDVLAPMLKVKRRRTADCVLAGFRWHDNEPVVGSLLLEHPWPDGFNLDVSPVGRLSGAVSRWKPGRPLSWVPLRPHPVAEVAYDHLERDPRSCTYRQFAKP